MSLTVNLVAADGATHSLTEPEPTVNTSGFRQLNIPAHVQMRGVVLGPQWYGANQPATDTFWQMWHFFNGGAPSTSMGTPVGYGGWTTWWKPALDAAVTVGNCVRIIGDPSLVINGTSQATYLGWWKTILDYCQSIGLYVYATNIGFERWGWAPNSSTALLTTLHAGWAQLLAQYPNVIAVDISNEACWSTSSALDNTATGNPTGNANSQSYTNMLLACAAAVRANCSLAVTYSASITAQGQVPWNWFAAGWFPHSMQLLTDADFMDFHLYANPMLTPAMLQAYHSDPNKLGIYSYSLGKQQLHGEFNAAGASSASRTALFDAIATISATNSSFDGGAIVWQNYDFNPYPLTSTGQSSSPPANQVGLWQYQGGPFRTDVSGAFATIPVTR